MDVQLKDFQLINAWKPDSDGPKWAGGQPKYLIDLSTGRKYWNEPKEVVGTKALLLAIGTPVVHTIAGVIVAAGRALKLLSLYHLWAPNGGTIEERRKSACRDLLKIVTAPLAIAGLELAALYGIFNPYDGRKLYASIERAQYGSFILAPCFQPDPQSHALGGDPEVQGAF